MAEETKGSRNIAKLVDIVGGQTALAEIIGVTQSAVSNWARGKLRPEGDRLVALLALLEKHDLSTTYEDFLSVEEKQDLRKALTRISRTGTEG